jgi:uncharacterized membrane protein YvbJ
MTPNYKHIEELMDRFFEGRTSNEEERELYAFFSHEDIPEHLQKFKPVFAYFETGIDKEFNQPEIVQTTRFQPNKKNILLWAGVAASLLILVSIRFFSVTNIQDFDPYEGSYIIRNGVKITDPEIVRPEIEKTWQMAMLQQAEYEQLIQKMSNPENPYLQIMSEIEQQKEEVLNQFEDETIRNEVKKILNKQL